VTNLAGAAVGLGLKSLTDPRIRVGNRPRPYRVAVIGGSALMLIIVLMPVGDAAAALLKRNRDFPCLVCPTSRLDLVLIETNGASIELSPHRSSTRSAIAIQMEDGEWPGVAWPEPIRDWAGWLALELDLGNPGSSAIDVTLRIEDAVHDFRFDDRFNLRISIPAESRRRLCILLSQLRHAPARREMDLSHVSQFMLFGTDASHGQELHVYRIALLGKTDSGAEPADRRPGCRNGASACDSKDPEAPCPGASASEAASG
jgi:hypothetical protein